jgi:hypothetical protein
MALVVGWDDDYSYFVLYYCNSNTLDSEQNKKWKLWLLLSYIDT